MEIDDHLEPNKVTAKVVAVVVTAVVVASAEGIAITVVVFGIAAVLTASKLLVPFLCSLVLLLLLMLCWLQFFCRGYPNRCCGSRAR